ncbi:hypothetical protein AN639_06035 [Candidatus Epulonipiscium fishelsonii]|uniref:Uncharacterized protein n=1 Tax=Candidatus Epulonipiscium fishelsonii TaxID=77094 RepID=A0ACC8XDW5_9FIRM|nr:hypothetical protein AN639_06035 [Epulopiscium sp. SCG-B05WGA-EpuloA1]ONI41071.1 hypothetical protein AN396_04790 [Epulopiscium sp. SCG-B11WGA-EpuloA1]
MKKFVTVALASMLMSSTLLATPFDDINNSAYKSSIEALYNKGIILGKEVGFDPTGTLSRQEGAILISRAFKLVDVPYRISPNETLEKTFISTDTSMAMLESAVMPATTGLPKWSEAEVETIIEARIMDIDSGNFNPTSTMTRNEFALAVGKAIYGPENSVDYIQQAIDDGLLPSDVVYDDTNITREEAAYILDNIVSNENFAIVPIMVTADIHGHLVSEPKGSMELGGMSRVGTLVEQLRELDENMLLLDGGDSPYNTNLANLFEGRSTVDVMNTLEYDATVLGNHDFDFVFENLLALAEQANYKMLSANTYMKDSTYPEQLEEYYVEEVNGIKVAVVGLTDENSKDSTHYTNTQDIELRDHFDVGRDVVARADAESDVVIALAHLHSHNMKLPVEVEGVDVEIAGGNDIFGRPEYVEDTLVINPGAHSACLTQVNINVLNKEMVGYTANQFVITEVIPENEEVKQVVDKYVDEMGTMMNDVVAVATEQFKWSAPLVRTQENALANIAADSQREYFEADIALQNGGGVRAGIEQGDVTLNDVYTAFPFDNRMILIETTGQVVWEALEHGIAGYPATAGQFLQVSGLSYKFDGSKPAGERMISVTMPDGTPLELDKTYKVVINDFMGGGGDGYDMFNVLNPNTESGLTDRSTLLLNTNDYIRDLFNNYVKEKGEITPVLEGRIEIINPQENNSKIG